MTAPTDGLCVAGMHRSGTSLTASWLAASDVRVHAGRLMGPAAGNPRGHYEDLDFVDLHDASFRRQVPGSRGWIVVDDSGALRFDADERRRARVLLRDRRSLDAPWAWKDPRATMFIRDWLTLDAGLRVVVLWRPMAAVVDSLLARARESESFDAQVDNEAARRCWFAYNRAALAARKTWPHRVTVIGLSQLLAREESVRAGLMDAAHTSLEWATFDGIFAPELLHPDPGTCVHRDSYAARLEDELATASVVSADV